MTNRNYEFVPEDVINIDGHILTRIRATKDIPHHNVKVGDLGGYIEACGNLSGDAWVSDNARVYGYAEIEKSSDVIILGLAKSSGRYSYAFKDSKIGVRVVTGCFSGSIDEFKSAIEETHEDTPEYLKQYRCFVSVIEEHF